MEKQPILTLLLAVAMAVSVQGTVFSPSPYFAACAEYMTQIKFVFPATTISQSKHTPSPTHS